MCGGIATQGFSSELCVGGKQPLVYVLHFADFLQNAVFLFSRLPIVDLNLPTIVDFSYDCCRFYSTYSAGLSLPF